jgi:hypothetical protein
MQPAARHLLAALHEQQGRDHALLAGLGESDWDAVADLAIRQQVGALLYNQRDLPISAGARDTLRERAKSSALRSLRFQATLRQLVNRLAPAGIELIVLKGMHLALSVYSTSAQREMGDIDVLVPAAKAFEVQETAKAMGFRPIYQTAEDLAVQISHHLPPLQKGAVGLEVHYQLSPPQDSVEVDIEGVLARTRPVPGLGQLRQLCDEDLVLHLCFHAANNHVLEMGLRPLCDLQAVLRQAAGTLDWTDLARRAKEWKCERSVALMLRLTERFLGAPVPKALFVSSAFEVPDQVLDEAIQLLAEDLTTLGNKGREAGRTISMRGARAKWRHVVDRIRLHPAELAALYPGSERGGWRRGVAIGRRVADLLRRNSGWFLRAASGLDSDLRRMIDRRNRLITWLGPQPPEG